METTTDNGQKESTSRPEPERVRRGVAWTGVIIGVGAAVLQPELIPGLAIGAALALAPRYAPRLGERLRSMGRRMRGAGEQTEREAKRAEASIENAGQSPEATRH